MFKILFFTSEHPFNIQPMFKISATEIFIGMLHASTGPTHENELLSSINVPSVGESTVESLESKRNRWKEESGKENVEIGAPYHMEWQEKGKAHNSPTGTLQILHLLEFKRVHVDMHLHRKLLFFLWIVL